MERQENESSRSFIRQNFRSFAHAQIALPFWLKNQQIGFNRPTPYFTETSCQSSSADTDCYTIFHLEMSLTGLDHYLVLEHISQQLRASHQVMSKWCMSNTIGVLHAAQRNRIIRIMQAWLKMIEGQSRIGQKESAWCKERGIYRSEWLSNIKQHHFGNSLRCHAPIFGGVAVKGSVKTCRWHVYQNCFTCDSKEV